jgi:hypothetical protein
LRERFAFHASDARTFDDARSMGDAACVEACRAAIVDSFVCSERRGAVEPIA